MAVLETKTKRLMDVLHDWVGKNFRYGEEGQCAAFVRHAWEGAELQLPSEGPPDLAESFASNKIGPKVTVRDIRPGDILLFKNTYGNFPSGTITHVGTCVGSNMMVDRPTSSRPVMIRSIFLFGLDSIAQIRRPAVLTEEPPVRVEFHGPAGEVTIPCSPALDGDKIRADLKPVCVSFGIDIEYNKENNLVILRRKQ
jgi:NlpC/P60 family